MTLDKSKFEELLAKAKYQFLLKDGKSIYFIPISREVTHTDDSFIAKNETKNTIEIVDYSTIISVTIDGKEISCDDC